MIALSLLGTGNYSEVTYKDDTSNKECRSKYFVEVVFKIYSPEKIFIILTNEAAEKHSTELASRIAFTPIYIPSGKTADEIWEMFSIIADSIPENSELLIDITHGFRSQPMLILSMAVFLRVIKSVKINKIIYGAFEAKNKDDVAPIFDLTPFIDLIDWSYATELFIKNGLSNLLSKLLKDLHNKVRTESQIISTLQKLGSNFQDMTESLTFIRPQEVAKLSRKLKTTILKATQDLERIKATEPLKYLLEKIPSSLNNLMLSDDENLFSYDGFRMQAEMINFYLETHQYVQAITLSREVLVSLVCRNYSLKFIKRDDRLKAEEKLNEWSDYISNGILLEEFPLRIGKLWSKIRDARNDISHAGMREGDLLASKLKSNIEKYCRETIEIINYANQSLQSSQE